MHMVETMAYAGKTPWHGLGVRVEDNLMPDEMLTVAGLDWEVEKRDMTFQLESGTRSVVPGKSALVRSSDETLLDIVGNDWNPLQNSDAFDFFYDFVENGDMQMHTAGSLDDGRRVWALAKVNNAFEVFKGDVVEQFLLLSNPHKYGMSIDVRMTPIRVVCNNTLTFALNTKAEHLVKVNHRKEFDVETVRETLGVAQEKLDVYREASLFIGSKRYSRENVVEFFTRVFPKSGKKDPEALSRNAKEALKVLETQPGAEFGEGTWWQAFNTVTFMTDHTLGRSVDTRMQSAWFGANYKKKIDALGLAVEYAEAA
jgi:phage/plasmid-like protein (TIGR03299 family)